MHVTITRVRYGETDQMGVVYHANYLVYFELGRTELIRDLGVAYSAFETSGLRLPVIEAGMRLRQPALYDDDLQIETTVTEATRVRVRFDYRVQRERDGAVLADGHTVHACVDESGRPRRFAPEVQERLARVVASERREAP